MQKNPYFSKDTIGQKSMQLLNTATRNRPLRPGRLDTRSAALLVLDMQHFFLSPESHAFVPSAPAILPGINVLGDFFLAQKRPLIMTRHLNTDADAGMMAHWWRDRIDERNALSELSFTFNHPLQKIMNKNQYDAFYKTELLQLLHRSATRQVVICGVLTHLCCETTARAAFVHGFDVFFMADGTATYSEEFHLASLLNLAHGFAHLSTVSSLIDSRNG